MDTELPTRANARTDSEEPKPDKSRSAIDEPNRAAHLIAKLAPMRKFPRRDSVLPNWA
jgi:hypothetical protein